MSHPLGSPNTPTANAVYSGRPLYPQLFIEKNHGPDSPYKVANMTPPPPAPHVYQPAPAPDPNLLLAQALAEQTAALNALANQPAPTIVFPEFPSIPEPIPAPPPPAPIASIALPDYLRTNVTTNTNVGGRTGIPSTILTPLGKPKPKQTNQETLGSASVLGGA